MGSLLAVGLGPGDPCLLAPAALAAIAKAQAVVGYTRYVGLVDPALLEGKEVVATGMTAEVERCERAIELALSGRDTVVLSSGDSGIYAMAGLLWEMLDAGGLAERLPLTVIPGVPAFVAAAALLGAPLTHDFACISLSDLLTPMERIETRLECAARGDFVIVLYNPRSSRRKDNLAKALSIISGHRGPDTPLGVVRQAFRPGQEVVVTTLAQARPEEVDMLSILVVGNSETRLTLATDRKIMYTPRGYRRKYGLSTPHWQLPKKR